MQVRELAHSSRPGLLALAGKINASCASLRFQSLPMSNITRLLLRGYWAFFVVLGVACSSRAPLPLPDAATQEAFSITASSDTVAIPPFGSRELVFQLRGPRGEAVPGVVMHFSILDDADSPTSGGAQLSFSTALTDGDGAVTLEVIAGNGASEQKPLKFKVEASAGDIYPLDIPIFVTTGALASVEVMPVFTGILPIDNYSTGTNIYFYDDTSCDSVSPAHPAVPMRGIRPVPFGEPSTTFTSVVASGVHAVLGLAVDANLKVVAQGCSDLLGASLSSGQPMRVQLPLAWIYPSPAGRFHALSRFSLSTPLPGTVSAQEKWKDLSNDTCDPARLWLDCTIDALVAPSAEDPLDCQPGAGGEGPLGVLLADRRATSGASAPCASQLDGWGRPSLEAKVYALFPTASLDALHLGTLPDEIGSAMTSLTVHSTLTVTATDSPNGFNIDHELTAIELPNAAIHSLLTMADLAAPSPEAGFVPGVSRAGQLSLGLHGFTLRLAAAARSTFAASSLAPRLGADVADAGTFVEALLKLATQNDSGTVLQGCDALDSLLCAEVEQPPGCVRAACLLGANALIQRLDASFSALDGQNLDFFLSGSAPIVDRDGDGHADALGSNTTLAGPGLWSGTFKSRTGPPTNVYGSWTAERASAPSR
jgi:hypothetical protein